MRHRVSSGFMVYLTITFLLVLGIFAQSAAAEPRIDRLLVCHDIVIEESIYGSFPTPGECANDFTTAEPSLWLFVELYLDQQVNIEVTLLDPNQQEAWAWEGRMGPPPPYYGSWWVLGVLPVAANRRSIAREHNVPRQVTYRRSSSTATGVVRVEGEPARERPGEWTLTVSVEDGASSSTKFVLRSH